MNQSEIPSTRKRIVVLTGDQPRHHFFTKNLDTHTDLVGVVTEKKTTQEDNPVEKSNFLQNHQKNLLKYEIKCMGDRVPHFSNSIECEPGKINDKDILNWVLDLEPDYIALFGTSILNRDWIKNFQNKIINLHLGSSPRYRGSATLFWPFFNNEIEFVEATIHLAVEQVDAGDILSRVRLNPDSLRNYYQYTSDTIRLAIEEFPQVLIQFANQELSAIPQEVSERKYLYRKADFTDSALREVLNKYGI